MTNQIVRLGTTLVRLIGRPNAAVLSEHVALASVGVQIKPASCVLNMVGFLTLAFVECDQHAVVQRLTAGPIRNPQSPIQSARQVEASRATYRISNSLSEFHRGGGQRFDQFEFESKLVLVLDLYSPQLI